MIDLNLSGKTVLVTGGTRGIGRAISEALAGQGATVVANYVRNQGAADRLLEDNPDLAERITPLKADLSRDSGIEKLTEATALRTLDGIVHCAVTGIHKPLPELSLRHWDWTFGVNLRAFFALIIALRQRLTLGASIVALTSEGAERAAPNYALVGASKGGLEALCRHLALELREQQVRVNVVSAGSVVTGAWDAFPDKEEKIAALDQLLGPDQRLEPAEVAATVLFLCSAAASGINAQTLVVDRGERVFR
ncbi:MAG: SDR family oxidoreductase [Pseudomonadota bacterium]